MTIRINTGQTFEILGSRKSIPAGVKPTQAYFVIVARDNEGRIQYLDPSEVNLTQKHARDMKHI